MGLNTCAVAGYQQAVDRSQNEVLWTQYELVVRLGRRVEGGVVEIGGGLTGSEWVGGGRRTSGGLVYAHLRKCSSSRSHTRTLETL